MVGTLLARAESPVSTLSFGTVKMCLTRIELFSTLTVRTFTLTRFGLVVPCRVRPNSIECLSTLWACRAVMHLPCSLLSTALWTRTVLFVVALIRTDAIGSIKSSVYRSRLLSGGMHLAVGNRCRLMVNMHIRNMVMRNRGTVLLTMVRNRSVPLI